MPVIRCPRHDIPYNDENPRGCPACALEREGEAEAARLMRDLARASRGTPAVEVLPPEPEPDGVVEPYADWQPVTRPPRLPTAPPPPFGRVLRLLRENRLAVLGAAAGVLGLVLTYLLTRPAFVEQFIPPLVAGEARPFPVEPNVPVVAAFALLGSVSPQTSPDAPALARYDFGGGALMDALNGVVYAVTLETPERTWHGHRVGLGEQPARGALALEGAIIEQEPLDASPFPFGGFLTYRSRETMPRRVLTTEVRPPNGCYDVTVSIAPQIIGTASRGEHQFVAVARRGDPILWVVQRVRVVSRAVDGPWGSMACQ
jgi:hypothetical protein